MKAIQITAYGNPLEGLEVVDIAEPPPPGPGEVLISVEFAPVNHNDLLLIGGKFPVHPELPSVGGNEGVGVVLQVGSGVENVKEGDRVTPPLYSFTWRERMVIPAKDLVPLPKDADPQQLSMLRINPPTAALLLSEFADLKPGDWVVQNCANSGVGRAVIAIAKGRGFKTVNFVRRQEQVAEVEAAGGDLVLVDEGDATEKVAGLVGDGRVLLALDGISGNATARLISALSTGGTLVNYAQMSGDMSAPGDLRPLMRKSITLHNFYQARKEFLPKIPEILRESIELIRTGKLHVPVAAIYPMSSIKEAVAHTQRGGKVLLGIADTH
ncbi:zinc-dependent alcohol dehydrogenase family protein [Pseudomonas sp. NPDC090203]|uniref:zinc-dependent alcohol dehydrogenase family protein n=1 Tax=Pseudomonas sp. NPDC090203 TaxID=3364477 RepID=UPI003816200A